VKLYRAFGSLRAFGRGPVQKAVVVLPEIAEGSMI